jgi:PUA-domain protein
MPHKQLRHSLKSKEAKQILTQASQTLKVDLEELVGAKANVEVAEADFATVYLINQKPALYKTDNRIFPTLLFTDLHAHLPKIVVDMGAVPYVCKGADIMAPGIVRIEGEFSKGDLVLVVDLKYGKALAIGEALQEAETARQTKQGPVVKNLHYVSDKIWNYAKTLTE